MDYIDNEKLIQDVKMIIKIPGLRAALFHKVEEYKSSHSKRIEEYRELEKIVDPGKREKTEEPVKELRFEIRKKKTGWTVNPVDIPQEIVNHIISHGLKPGIIKMQKFKLSDGRNIDLSFEMQSRGCFTGSIIEKQKETEKETPIEQARNTENKAGDLKIIITYLLNNETFYNWMISEFFENWKPLIDSGCINKINER